MSAVADTHAVVWYVDAPANLTADATAALDAAARTAGEHIYISAITLVEIRYLTEKGRIDAAVLTRVEAEINAAVAPRILVYPLDAEIAAALGSIPRSVVPEMPDRIIAATAFFLGLPLVSADGKIQKLSNITVVW